jgi:hypothetical protein
MFKKLLMTYLTKFFERDNLKRKYYKIEEFYFKLKFLIYKISSLFIINKFWLKTQFKNQGFIYSKTFSKLKDKKFIKKHNFLKEELKNIKNNNYCFLSKKYHNYTKPQFINIQNDNKYKNINWFYDPIRNLNFDLKTYYKNFDYLKMRPNNFDIKYSWELSRLQHLTILGQNYIIFEDDNCLDEIILQINDFNQNNPIGYSINWTCTMDVAIRAANISIACNYLMTSKKNLSQIIDIYRKLYLHGIFIYENLENTYEVTSNHYLSNLVGLLYVANTFKTKSFGKKWLNFCVNELEVEIEKQIEKDGSDYESSIPYHKLVLELFLSAYRLSLISNFNFTKNFEKKLEKMVLFLNNVCNHSNEIPQVGDNDDGRFFIFDHDAKRNNLNCNYLFSLADEVLNLKDLVYENNEWELLNWGFETKEDKFKNEVKNNKFSFHKDAGIMVLKNSQDYFLVSNGKVGTNGFGNHKHNDLLSFEYHIQKKPIFVDIGSYVYTSSHFKRNYFRSIKNHNTFSVDDIEPNGLKKEYLFRLFENSDPNIHKAKMYRNNCFFSGSHSGFSKTQNNKNNVLRLFFFNTKNSELFIKDKINFNDFKNIFWNFSCYINVKPKILENGKILISTTDTKMIMEYDQKLKLKIKNGFYSNGYGKKYPNKKITFQTHLNKNNNNIYKFKISLLR